MTNSTHWSNALQIALSNGWDDQEISERLHELVEILDNLSVLYTSDLFESYLTGTNAHLGGARPVDCARIGDFELVLETIEAQREGAFA